MKHANRILVYHERLIFVNVQGLPVQNLPICQVERKPGLVQKITREQFQRRRLGNSQPTIQITEEN